MASLSLVIPVYRNSESLVALLDALRHLEDELDGSLEVVFVVDGCPDGCYPDLRQALVDEPYQSQLLLLSRNFGSFAAIRAGLAAARGPYFAVMAADLQEPPELVHQFYQLLSSDKCDVVVGVRAGRHDPLMSKMASGLFWALYRRFVMKEMPKGGIDVFGCNELVRDSLLHLRESHSSLVGLLLWVGYRRQEISYTRRARLQGRSAWTFYKKFRYMVDSIFSFSDLPIRLLTRTGVLGMCLSVLFAVLVVLAKSSQQIPVPGYAATVTAISFFGGLNCFGLGVIGAYCWRTYENTKGRPNSIVALKHQFAQKVSEMRINE